METFITIVDSVVGRRSGGHQEDYLTALEKALRDLRPTTFAPYRGGCAAVAIRKQQPRWKQHWYHFRALRSRMRKHERRLLLFPNPDFRDFAIFFAATWLSMRRMRDRRVIALFVLRRNAAGIVGHSGLKARILSYVVNSLEQRGHLYPVSDSRAALREWCSATGTDGSLITIPIREQPPEKPVKLESDPVVFGLLGLYRPEKGSEHYDLIVRAVLSLPLPVRIHIQLPDRPDSMGDPQARDLLECWEDSEKVHFCFGHLDADAYTRVLSDVDVLVLPYDVAKYGSGTSGVMFEASRLGAVAVSTRFQWAVDTFENQPDVVWLDAVTSDFLADALHGAAKRALEKRKQKPSRISKQNEFAASWNSAIAAARARFDG